MITEPSNKTLLLALCRGGALCWLPAPIPGRAAAPCPAAKPTGGTGPEPLGGTPAPPTPLPRPHFGRGPPARTGAAGGRGAAAGGGQGGCSAAPPAPPAPPGPPVPVPGAAGRGCSRRGSEPRSASLLQCSLKRLAQTARAEPNFLLPLSPALCSALIESPY